MTRNCKSCGNVLIRPPKIGKKQWASRQFCSHACANDGLKIEYSTTCAKCGSQFQANAHGTRRRKYCSRKCSATNRGNPARYRKVGEKLEHRKVMEGVLGRPLMPFETVHHKNGLRLDNSPENLELWLRPQPAGQRASDLMDWLFENYAEEITRRFAENAIRNLFSRAMERTDGGRAGTADSRPASPAIATGPVRVRAAA